MENDTYVSYLKECIELMLDRKMLTPKDFDFLSEQIFVRLNIMVSSTTLKRLWGYLNEGNVPRKSTLSILSQFVGYRDWESLVESVEEGEHLPQSNLILSRRLSSYSLSRGNVLILTWLPDRLCKVLYLGDGNYEVLDSKNSKLSVGDTFHCSIFIEGEPLYIDNLTHGPYHDIAYIAGKKDGIRFELSQEKFIQ